MRRAVLIIAVLLLLSWLRPTGALTDGGEVEESGWVRLVTSGDESERWHAHRAAAAHRQADIDALLAVVRSPVREGEPFFDYSTPRNTAIRILGIVRAEEAVPDLMEWLDSHEGQSRVYGELLMFSPAGYALVEIGLPSVPPLLEKLKAVGMSRPGLECLKILVRIKGADEAEFTLKKAIETESDQLRKRNLKAALKKLRDPKFPADKLTK